MGGWCIAVRAVQLGAAGSATVTEDAGGLRGTSVTALLLLEGFCSLAIEMLALRVLVPVAGQSVGVTSVVVAVFLAALAAGYRSGGQARGAARDRVARSFGLAALWAGVWLSRAGVDGAFGVTAWLPTLGQVAAFSLVAVAPPAFWLASTVVVLVSCGREAGSSERAGRAFAASTVGNVAGGLATALLVMRFLGVSWALALVVGLLALAAVCVARRGRQAWGVGLCACVGAASASANVALERSAFVRTTAFADYAIERAGGVRVLRVNGQNASRDDAAGRGHPYLERIEEAVYGRLGRRGGRVLVVGAGGFTFGRGREAAGIRVVFVDVDPALGEVAARFLEGERPGVYVPLDGRRYLVENEERWDAIVLDAFVDRAGMPGHLLTAEAFGLVRRRLADDGELFVNVIARARPGAFEARFERTLRSVFASCDVERVGGGELYNRLYRCIRSDWDADVVRYTDGTTAAEVDVAGLGFG